MYNVKCKMYLVKTKESLFFYYIFENLTKRHMMFLRHVAYLNIKINQLKREKNKGKKTKGKWRENEGKKTKGKWREKNKGKMKGKKKPRKKNQGNLKKISECTFNNSQGMTTKKLSIVPAKAPPTKFSPNLRFYEQGTSREGSEGERVWRREWRKESEGKRVKEREWRKARRKESEWRKDSEGKIVKERVKERVKGREWRERVKEREWRREWVKEMWVKERVSEGEREWRREWVKVKGSERRGASKRRKGEYVAGFLASL
jgi:hypothetical protein